MRKLMIAGLALFLSGCLFSPSKSDIVHKAAGADTRQQLLSALGQPDDTARLGPLEKWTYKACDGTVIFVIVGDQVTVQTSTDKNGAEK